MKKLFIVGFSTLMLLHDHGIAAPVVVDFGDSTQWTPILTGSGIQLAGAGNGFQVDWAANASGSQPFYGADMGAGYYSSFLLHGDFSITVDFNLAVWPPANGVRLGLGLMLPGTGIERSSQLDGRELYSSYDNWMYSHVPTTDLTGGLRLSRIGSTLYGYYEGPTGWVQIGSGPISSRDYEVGFTTWSGTGVFGGKAVDLAMTGAEITAAAITPTPGPGPVPVPEQLSPIFCGGVLLGFLLVHLSWQRPRAIRALR